MDFEPINKKKTIMGKNKDKKKGTRMRKEAMISAILTSFILTQRTLQLQTVSKIMA
jgi:hypothetical protein